MRVLSSVRALTALLGMALGGSLVLGACARRVETATPATPEDCGTGADTWPNLFPEGTSVQRLNPDFSKQVPGLLGEHSLQCTKSRHLRVMSEPGLLPSPPGVEVYRFLWLRSFHDPVVLRLVARGGTASLVVRRRQGIMGEPGLFIVDRTVPVSPAQLAEFLRLLEASRFWNPPAFPPGDVIYSDGATWMLEGVRDGHYRAMDVHSPDETGLPGAYRSACLYLLTLSGLQIPTDEIY
jgi:hypothetical protein